jgi:aryl-alcohol dehydrogenase-like predicted oxidoreductase
MRSGTVQLGLGLIGIGKPWGVRPHPVPGEDAARGLLECAFDLGIRYFDTAPSYGEASEARLGAFLRGLTPDGRAQVTVATKMGEHWDAAAGAPYVDHSLDALRRSLDGSLERLGRVDVLQLHKTTQAALASRDVERAWDYAAGLGIRRIGASVSEVESGRLAIAEARFSVIQLPFHSGRGEFAPLIGEAAARGMWIAVNRPFAMGALAGGDKRAAFRFILERRFTGVILSGTTSPEHLRENVLAFQESSA